MSKKHPYGLREELKYTAGVACFLGLLIGVVSGLIWCLGQVIDASMKFPRASLYGAGAVVLLLGSRAIARGILEQLAKEPSGTATALQEPGAHTVSLGEREGVRANPPSPGGEGHGEGGPSAAVEKETQ